MKGEPARSDPSRPAVHRVYRELRDRGQPDRFAFEAALTVYLWHHPGEPVAQAGDVVHCWLAADVRH
jgi:hypothetical protein